jgi:hypothetical protein
VSVKLHRIAGRLAHGDVAYALGRFKTVRSTYSGARHAVARLNGDSGELPPGRASLFGGVDIEDAVRSIRRDAVFIGLYLPADTVAEIAAFARAEPLHPIDGLNEPEFSYSDVVRGKCADGRTLAGGAIRDPERCPAVKAVVEDPVLRAIVRGYLGHAPRRVMTLLHWSFASDVAYSKLLSLNVTLDYHYDVAGFDFCYASFYILDTDHNSGAHVMMKRSHNKKPLRMLLGSARASEAAVRRQFGIANEITIEGRAGLGFVQDTSCYHRATPPVDRDRLMLAIRFVN